MSLLPPDQPMNVSRILRSTLTRVVPKTGTCLWLPCSHPMCHLWQETILHTLIKKNLRPWSYAPGMR